MKARVKFEMAKEMNDKMTKPMGVNELMKLPKKEFCKLWYGYCSFCEAEDSMGDLEP